MDPLHAHRVFFADSIGCLRVAHAHSQQLPEDYAGPQVQTVVLPGFRSHSDQAVQRMAQGHLANDAWVVAMARKNGSIDVVQIEDASEGSSAAGPGVKATVLHTIKEDRMKAGIHRWVGLAVAKNGIYSCTSTGAFRFTPVNLEDLEAPAQPTLLELPGPLQHLVFYPAADPTHFSYGGEEVPVSLWDVAVALSEQPQSMAGDESIESVTEGGNAKMRKRKRQAEARAKAKEHMWGELWKAKNLPNNSLSLPQRANITQVAIVAMDEEKEALNGATIVVGTRDGLIRVYEPGKGKKHTREHRVVHAGEGSVKTMGLGASEGELFVADTAGKLCAVDWRDGRIQYSYKDITGAITSFCALPRSEGAPLLISTSQDKLVRLHTTVPPVENAPGRSKQRGETIWTTFASSSNAAPATMMTACVWDGRIPEALPDAQPHSTNGDGESDDSEGDEEEEDEIWSIMQAVGAKQPNEADETAEGEVQRTKRSRK